MYAVYIDILFIVNWIMDSLIFYCVTLVLNKKIKHWRIIIAGMIAAILYCMLVIFPILQCVPYWLYTLFIPACSILYLYKPHKLKAFFKIYILSMMISAVFGGLIFNIWYTFGAYTKGIHFMGMGMLIGIGLVIACLFYSGFYFLRRRFIFPAFEYQLKLKNHGRSSELRALLDTGNLLYTPISHLPVIVVEYEMAKEVLTEAQRISFESYRRSSEIEIEEGLVNGECRPDVLIPFNSVGCKSGYLWGFKVEEVTIKRLSGERVISNCMIGMSNESLFSDKQYHALLHPEFILEEAMVS